jgi:acyl transferase domain-containing protein/acyl carrier protein
MYKEDENIRPGLDLAIVGMAGRFPGAQNIEAFWENLKKGIESITFFSDEELEKEGVSKKRLQDPNYVKAKGVLEGIDYFDAAFFEYRPPEARKLAPQIRLFHECTWAALEDAGYEPSNYKGLIGLYAGATNNVMWQWLTLFSGMGNDSESFAALQLCDKDHLSTRVSYKMNLKGPSLTIETQCSTSLVAFHVACQGLLSGECDIALAGGVSVSLPQKHGYQFQEGMIVSPDGHCRAFDAEAKGTVFGNGIGIVALKRVEDALSHGDQIYALVKGTAINNDGNRKAGYSAPSVDGQMEVIREALRMSEFEAETIGYVETHGTGTSLGDPIEIEALKLAYNTNKKGFCRIGSVKPNVGHLDNAAGITSLIKTVMVLKHRQIPPSINFKTPNPKIDFENSPFIVNTELREWERGTHTLRAGVSSFGFGGTNVHVVLEEAPELALPPAIKEGRGESCIRPNKSHLLLLSAKTPTALDQMTENLAEYLRKNPGQDISNIAFTLQMGRKSFLNKRMLVCHTIEDAAQALSPMDPSRIQTYTSKEEDKTIPVVFIFPGQGAQYVEMGRELYEREPLFREEMDRCFEILDKLEILNENIKEALYPTHPPTLNINDTRVTQPLIFIFEYAMAKLLMAWGIHAQAMIGHSIGEYTAACISGVFTLEETLRLVTRRGELMGQMPEGSMLSVPLPEEELKPLITGEISLAAINSPSLCVVSGTKEAIEDFSEQLKAKGIQTSQLHTSHAFHSKMMEPMLGEFEQEVKQLKIKPPGIPYISNLTGQWITGKEVMESQYWRDHLRNPVRFSQGIQEILKEERLILIEVGPGRVLSTFIGKHQEKNPLHKVMNLVRHPRETVSDQTYLLTKIGQCWLYGKKINWNPMHPEGKRMRVSLPLYSFQRQRYWIDNTKAQIRFPKPTESTEQTYPMKADMSDWFYRPQWKELEIQGENTEHKTMGTWILFQDEEGIGKELQEQLEKQEIQIVSVKTGNQFQKKNSKEYIINPGEAEDYQRLLKEIELGKQPMEKILHLWNIQTKDQRLVNWEEKSNQLQILGIYSLINLAKAIGNQGITREIQLHVITSHLQKVNPEDHVEPDKATILGPIGVIPKEYPNIYCKSIDIHMAVTGKGKGIDEDRIETLITECVNRTKETIIAYRENKRYVREFETLRLEKADKKTIKLRAKGVYLITGGMGGIGLEVAKGLVTDYQARVALIGRTPLPPRKEWTQWLENHDEKDSITIKIKKIQELEKLGGEVQAYKADVAEKQQIQRVLEQVEEKWGKINGVFHTAGKADTGGIIQMREREVTQEILLPKVKGTWILKECFTNYKLDVFILFSSLSSLLSPFGEVGYSAACAFLDAIAQSNTLPGEAVASINWDAWKEVGMAVKAIEQKNTPQQQARAILATYGISPSEGIEALYRVLGTTRPQVAISTIDLTTKMQYKPGIRKAETPKETLMEKTPGTSQNQRPELSTPYMPPETETEKVLAEIWQEHLGIEKVGIHDNFFDLGANSLDLLQVNGRLQKIIKKEIPIVNFYTYPTIDSLKIYLDTQEGIQIPTKVEASQRTEEQETKIHKKRWENKEIAIIGMSGRFPGARNLEEFWKNLKEGKETITHFNDREMEAEGISTRLLTNPRYVKSKGIIEDVEYFDAAFFEYKPAEARSLDPQIRVFQECVWETLEQAGYETKTSQKTIGLYAGASDNIHWRGKIVFSGGQFSEHLLSNKDVLSTQISYKLNLKGPSFSIQTACSTSLVALHLACRALMMGECDMALAGGVSITLPVKSGYMYQEGMIHSSDGHCRPFDEKANGTVFGNGAGVVLLKTLEQALEEGDTIHAVIKGTAINNDGEQKVGFTAPSTIGQTQVIRAALQTAEIEPETINYVEAHGTGTNIGDPIEIEALKTAYTSSKKQYCRIGSVKSNIGHLDAAAGAASLIKTILSMKHRLIPPSINFDTPNKKIEFENSPFLVNTELWPWNNGEHPLRAGVSSFGFGGTNTHVILEEAPSLPPTNIRPNNSHLLLLSAKTPTALKNITENLINHLENHPEVPFEDTAYTLLVGRRNFPHRCMLVCNGREEAIDLLKTKNLNHLKLANVKDQNTRRYVVFMFPGQGAQYVNMGLELYETQKTFREIVDYCFEIIDQLGILNINLKEILYPTLTPALNGGGSLNINDTQVTQPLIFIFEYALAQLLMKWGIIPNAMIGHSIGEYTAACLSGVLNLEEALELVAERGKLMQQLPTGGMLSVPLSLEKLEPLLEDHRELSLAAVNSPNLCVVSGEQKAIDTFAQKLKEQEIQTSHLHTSHAFHSSMMEPMMEEFSKIVRIKRLGKPRIPYVSNLTGTWVTSEQAQETEYWTKHLRNTVRFSDGIKELAEKEPALFIEVGPGRTLSTLLLKQTGRKTLQKSINLIRHPKEKVEDTRYLLDKIGQTWLFGVPIDWKAYYGEQSRKRVPLPTYPFERSRYWMEKEDNSITIAKESSLELFRKKSDVSDWIYVPQWICSIQDPYNQPSFNTEKKEKWVIFQDLAGLGERIANHLKQKHQEVIIVRIGTRFSIVSDTEYTINPTQYNGYLSLFNVLKSAGKIPHTILHMWGVTQDMSKQPVIERVEMAQDLGLYSLIHIAQAINQQGIKDEIILTVFTNGMQDLTGEGVPFPEKATVLGPVRVIPKEQPNIKCTSIDLELTETENWLKEARINYLLAELQPGLKEKETRRITVKALKGNFRMELIFEPKSFKKGDTSCMPLSENGVYLITGGLGGISLAISRYLAETYQAKLILVGRSRFPGRKVWQEWINVHGEEETISRKIQKIREIEKLGAQVQVYSADITNQEQIGKVIEDAEAQFGTINGVIHAAGIVDKAGLIIRRTREDTETVLSSKIQGTLNLDGLLGERQLDFFVCCSSLSSVYGPPGEVGYCAANAFLDAFASYRNHKNCQFATSIGWDAWQEVGMAKDSVNKLTGKKLETNQKILQENGIRIEEGIDLLERILCKPIPHVLISTNDLKLKQKQAQREIKKDKIIKKEGPGKTGEPVKMYQRPEMGTEYTAPANEIEKRLVKIWQEHLGMDKVGIHDNFFDLGANSLDIIQVNRKINEAFKTDMMVDTLFEFPTVEALADHLIQKDKQKEKEIEAKGEKKLEKASNRMGRTFKQLKVKK